MDRQATWPVTSPAGQPFPQGSRCFRGLGGHFVGQLVGHSVNPSPVGVTRKEHPVQRKVTCLAGAKLGHGARCPWKGWEVSRWGDKSAMSGVGLGVVVGNRTKWP